MEEEIWRDMEDASNYEVSNLGNIRHKIRKQNRRLQVNKNGYKCVTVRENGKHKSIYVHIAVAKAFIPNPDGLPQINHLDEDKTNNYVKNLEWCSCKENINYGTHNERAHNALKKPVYCVELDKTFDSVKTAAEIIGVHPTTIGAVCRGDKYCKTAGGYHWQYVS